jgi:hypothetical protein
MSAPLFVGDAYHAQGQYIAAQHAAKTIIQHLIMVFAV